MAREYPRFLFSNPKNTKSRGPFIVHTIFPKALFKINYQVMLGQPQLEIEPLDYFDSCTDEESEQVMKDLSNWIFAQIKIKAIKL